MLRAAPHAVRFEKNLRNLSLLATVPASVPRAIRRSPACQAVVARYSLLDALNKRLLGRGDAFATCLALRIDISGNVTLANAGHLAPYLNGKALSLEGSLPLGMLETPEFSLLRFELRPDDRLMLLSDGVAEATDADGRLFGFDRVQELLHTATSASEIANAAQAFGQEDHISVISVTRTAVLAALA